MVLNKLEILKLFRENLILFLEDLINLFPQEGDFIKARLFLHDCPLEELLKYCSTILINNSTKIINRDEDFFLTNISGLLNCTTDVSTQKVNYFKSLWLSDTMSPEDRIEMWNWFKNFLRISQEYNKLITM